MRYWERGVLGRNKASYLCHHSHQRDRSDVGALPAHIAASDYLKPSLLCGINIIRNVPLHLYLLSDWMATAFDSESISQFRLDVVVDRNELSKRCNHVDHCDPFANFE